jgi:hypothetical protein
MSGCNSKNDKETIVCGEFTIPHDNLSPVLTGHMDRELSQDDAFYILNDFATQANNTDYVSSIELFDGTQSVTLYNDADNNVQVCYYKTEDDNATLYTDGKTVVLDYNGETQALTYKEASENTELCNIFDSVSPIELMTSTINDCLKPDVDPRTGYTNDDTFIYSGSSFRISIIDNVLYMSEADCGEYAIVYDANIELEMPNIN